MALPTQVNFLKKWQLTVADANGRIVFDIKSNDADSNYQGISFLVYPFGGIGYPSAASFTIYNLTQTQESLFQEEQIVTFSVGMGNSQKIVFKGYLKAFFGNYQKPDYVFHLYSLGIGTNTQYALTKQMLTIDIPESTLSDSANALADKLSIPVVNIFGVNGSDLTPPMKLIAKNFYNAMDLYCDHAQTSYCYDSIKNALNIYPNHKVYNQNFTQSSGAVKIVKDVIGFPSVDVGTQNMSCEILLTSKLVYFGDVIKLNLNLLDFTGVENAPIQYLVKRNQSANFFVHTTFYQGDSRLTENSSWIQKIYGVNQI
jgi:hypothetical protein